MSTLRPRKRLGQHFLHDPAVIKRIVTTIAPKPGDLMIEIGGGPGALTRPLLDALEHLHVVEIDARFAEGLRQFDAHPDRLTVYQRDALSLDLRTLTTPERKLRIVGNLPYNISTQLLFHFLQYRELVHDMHFMLQKEVVARMTAAPGNKIYGRLTVMLAAWTDIEACFDIGPGAFKPPPKVRSTIVRIRPRLERRFPIEDDSHFARIVSKLFSMRRQTVARIVRDEVSGADIKAAGFDPRARPETLSPEAIARLASLCSHA
jgi:16S rRNA (adenine1518-N6/adenine1519-N6)-dimethyltransferase